MIFTPDEKLLLAHSLKHLDFDGTLYLLKGALSAQEDNKKKLITRYQKALPTNIESSWQSRGLSSWSHSQNWVGVWVSKGSCRVGFDIEERSRIKPKLIDRIQHRDDLISQDHPHASYSWVIKEASFKALSQATSIQTITEVALAELKPLNPRLNQFEALALHPNSKTILRALCFTKYNFHFCIAQSLPNVLNP